MLVSMKILKFANVGRKQTEEIYTTETQGKELNSKIKILIY